MNKSVGLPKKINNVNLYQKIIILIMVFSPFTSLRFFRIGISEILCVFLFFMVVINNYTLNFKKRGQFIFSKFWLIFLFSLCLGFSYKYFFLSFEKGSLESTIFDIIAYSIVFMTCISLEMIFYKKNEFDFEYVFKKIFIYSSSILSVLLILSLFMNGIGGYTLVDAAGNFKPLADNIHHLGMFIGPLPFIGLNNMKLEPKKRIKILYLVLIIFDIVIIFVMGSSKGVMGFILGGTLYFFSLFMTRMNKTKIRKILVIIFLTVVLSIIILNIEHLANIMYMLFFEADGEGARSKLYSIAFYKGLQSILVGFGPGLHVYLIPGVLEDTHSTLLTVFVQGGLIGWIPFFVLNIKILNSYKKSPYILAAICSIMIYMVGGDILRRIPIWIYLILFYYYSLNKSIENPPIK